jgi:PAS domain S-box-containing protein
MMTDFFQYQVNRRWYRLYWAFMVAWNVSIAAFFVASQFIDTFSTAAGSYDITKTTTIIASGSLFYLLFLYRFAVRFSQPFATLIGSMLLGLGLLHSLTNTVGASTYVYAAGWVCSTLFSGMFGLPLLSGAVFLTFVYVLLSSNYQLVHLRSVLYVLAGGEIVAAIASYMFWKHRFISVEEQKVSELSGELKSNKEQADVLIESIADGVIVTNTEGKITLINPAAAAMTGWSVADATGVDVTLVAILHLESGEDVVPEQNPFAVVLRQKEHSSQTLQLVGKDGKKQVVSLVISPVLQPGGNTLVGAVAVMRDVSEERAAEQQRADFISTASHEMRTPVAAIEGYLALALNEKVSTIDSRARGFLEKAHTSTQHLGQLFQDLLTSSKAEDGRLSNHPSVVEMGAFMQQLTDDLKFAAEKKGLFTEFLIGSTNDAIDATNKNTVSTHVLKPLYYVYVDPDRLREVITNLFDNACKYTDQGKNSIGLTGDTDVVQMYVRDTGAGIPADDVPHLFQKFYRVDNSATRTIGGTGLGLFISRKIVEMYHGRIWVESELGKGSTFFINLPRLTTQRAQSLQAEATQSTSAPVNSTGTQAKA